MPVGESNPAKDHPGYRSGNGTFVPSCKLGPRHRGAIQRQATVVPDIPELDRGAVREASDDDALARVDIGQSVADPN
jgi:hypothetical protein